MGRMPGIGMTYIPTELDRKRSARLCEILSALRAQYFIAPESGLRFGTDSLTRQALDTLLHAKLVKVVDGLAHFDDNGAGFRAAFRIEQKAEREKEDGEQISLIEQTLQ